MLFDKDVLKSERLDLARADDIIKISDRADHSRRLDAVSRTGEVAGHAVLELLGFSNVYDLPLRVLHNVNAGRQGQRIRLVSESLKHRHRSTSFS